MVSDMISEKLIRIDVEAADWKEAIRESAQHIALPHAPSEYGAKELAMGITVLRRPIEFGNEANDPVKYLFCLSAKDSNSHLESLAQLVDRLVRVCDVTTAIPRISHYEIQNSS